MTSRLLLLAAVWIGCGGGGEPGGAVDARSAGDSAVDTAAQLDAALGSGLGSGSGRIEIANYVSAQPALNSSRITTTIERSGCTYTVVAGCVAYAGCNLGASATYDVGEVTLTGTVPASPLVFQSGAGGDYSQTGPLYMAGVALGVTAMGGDLPGFTTSMTAPSQVTVTQPASGSAFAVPTDGLAVAWTGSSAGDVVVTMFENITDTSDVQGIHCRFPASAGAGVVPQAAIATLDEIDAVVFETSSASTVDADGWAVTVDATFNAVFADGADAVIAIH